MFLLNLLFNYQKYIKAFALSVFLAISSGCDNTKVMLVQDTNQDTARQIMVLLESHSIDTEEKVNKDGLYSLFVARSKKLAALQLLQNNGLPGSKYTNLGEVFKKDSFISSPLEEHSRFLFALDQEISQMLAQLNGVISVKTTVNIPASNDNLWQPEQPKSSASVLIKFQQGARVDLYVNKIKSLVSNAVPGLIPERVEVVAVIQKSY